MQTSDGVTKATSAALPVAHKKALRSAGLRFSNDTEPGYRRASKGGKFVYLGSSGAPLRNAKTLDRIRRLAIPPAYTDVWICRDADGHVQATARDARGRKQYRYHADWRSARDTTKYHRTLEFSAHLQPLRARVAQDIKLPGLPRRKVIAALVRLLETSHIRVGNEVYSRENGSFGLTTLKNRHVRIRGQRIQFAFRGKSGKFHDITLEDQRLARIVRHCQDLHGQALFQFRNDDGAVESVGSHDVNAYLRELTDDSFSAKDFRTWAGTLMMAQALNRAAAPENQTQAKAAIVEAVREVAEQLGNTPSVCRACYVHPAVLDSFLEGKLKLPPMPRRQALTRLSAQERSLQRLLKRYERANAKA